tara:strand:+ start:1936 stop:2466 length:531 start_codon:yes stop_codon:yes gene_type:complete
MNKRENLLWKMVLTIAVIGVAYYAYTLYYSNDDYFSLMNSFESEEIGTDKELKEKVQKLEISLKEKQDFITDGSDTKYYIAPEDNPSNIISVIDLEGFESMGSQHLKIENIWYSRKNNNYKANLINSYGQLISYMTVNDTISGGQIIAIGDNYVVFQKDNETFTYDLTENLIDEEN